MTNQILDECLRKLAGKARATGVFWDDTVADIYAEVLDRVSDEVGVELVSTAVFDRPNLPDVTELRRMINERSPERRKVVRDHSQPGHELQRQGVPAYELMRQGFMDAVHKMHPDFEGDWNEWVKQNPDTMKEWDRVMKRLDARSRDQADDDPFKWRPGEPLPLESDEEKARKRAAIETLRSQLGGRKADIA